MFVEIFLKIETATGLVQVALQYGNCGRRVLFLSPDELSADFRPRDKLFGISILLNQKQDFHRRSLA